MNTKPIYAIIAATFLLASCASTNFQQYEGRGGRKVVEGEGGTKEAIDGWLIGGAMLILAGNARALLRL